MVDVNVYLLRGERLDIVHRPIADGLAAVDVTPAFGSGGRSLSMSARLAQVVFTATQFTNVDRVELRIDGERIEWLGGEGPMLSEPQRRMDMSREITGSVIFDGVARAGATAIPTTLERRCSNDDAW